MKEWKHEVICKMCGKTSMSRYNDICNACYMKMWRAKRKKEENRRKFLITVVLWTGFMILTFILAKMTYQNYLIDNCKAICKPYNFELKNDCCYCVLDGKYKTMPSTWQVGNCENR
jgi:hypothetical protein